MKKIRVLIILSILIIIIIILSIYFIKNKEKTEQGLPYNIQIVSQTNEYFEVSMAIQRYCGYLKDSSFSKAYSLLDQEYINKYAITEESLSKNFNEADTNFIPQKMSVTKIDEYSKIYFVKGVSYKITKEKKDKYEQEDEPDEVVIYKPEELEQREYIENVFYIVKVDLENSSFAISKDISKYEEVFDSM